MDVREALLHDAEEGRLDRRRQSSDLAEIQSPPECRCAS